MTEAHLLARTSQERNERIGQRHLEHLAIVYIRQSSMQQVHRNQESTKIQYGLVGMAQRLGWANDRVLTIDDDLGISGSSAAGRAGFQRLLTEVALDHVGIILGAEMSRLARSNKDWHQLLELCARYGTLIADLDGLYDPSRYNDRLLLGLKGTMSEAELHILRQRLLEGKLHKARRGELGKPVPTGFLRTPSGEVTLDPDEEVQDVVRMVFEAFERLGSVRGVVRELANENVCVGVRSRCREDLGLLKWHRPHAGMIRNILRNPIYAGAYVYGRRRTDPRRQQPGRPATGRTPLLPPGDWQVCLRDRLPAYITWAQYERNQARLNENRPGGQGIGAIRGGVALLSGLIVCARCQLRMTAQYATRGSSSYYRYVCSQAAVRYGSEVCCGLSGARLDQVVADMVLTRLAPAALELSMKMSEEVEREREKAEMVWHKRLQRARYEAERAERQYQVAEPENRLVVRTLEKAWEAKLQAERALNEEFERRVQLTPRHLTSQERETIRELATNLPALWNAPTTAPEDRKSIVRMLIEKVLVKADDSEWVDIAVRWAGGRETSARMRRPVAKLTSLSEHQQLLDELRSLRQAGLSATQIATKLNEAGWVTPTQRNTFNERLVRAMILRYGPMPRGPRQPPNDGHGQEMWLSELAADLNIPIITLYGWLRRGWLKGRRVNGHWAIAADRRERRRLRDIRREHPSANRHH
jgi:DNA invertase Pin-like site-specific DNA recombinase